MPESEFLEDERELEAEPELELRERAGLPAAEPDRDRPDSSLLHHNTDSLPGYSVCQQQVLVCTGVDIYRGTDLLKSLLKS